MAGVGSGVAAARGRLWRRFRQSDGVSGKLLSAGHHEGVASGHGMHEFVCVFPLIRSVPLI